MLGNRDKNHPPAQQGIYTGRYDKYRPIHPFRSIKMENRTKESRYRHIITILRPPCMVCMGIRLPAPCAHPCAALHSNILFIAAFPHLKKRMHPQRARREHLSLLRPAPQGYGDTVPLGMNGEALSPASLFSAKESGAATQGAYPLPSESMNLPARAPMSSRLASSDNHSRGMLSAP
jgi:hypothetical protein